MIHVGKGGEVCKILTGRRKIEENEVKVLREKGCDGVGKAILEDQELGTVGFSPLCTAEMIVSILSFISVPFALYKSSLPVSEQNRFNISRYCSNVSVRK